MGLIGSAVGLLLFVFVAFAVSVLYRGCSGPPAIGGTDYMDEVKAEILGTLAEERRKNDERVQQIEEELSAIRFELEQLDYEIAESVKNREEIHDAIENARSIDDIDRALKRGISGASGRRDR